MRQHAERARTTSVGNILPPGDLSCAVTSHPNTAAAIPHRRRSRGNRGIGPPLSGLGGVNPTLSAVI